jgi:hypothetical protein
MRDLDRDLRCLQLAEDADRVLDRDAENAGKGGRRDHRGGGEHIHCRRGRGGPPAAGDRTPRLEPGPFDRREEIKAIGGLARQRAQECRQPRLQLPRLLGLQCRGTGERGGLTEEMTARPEADERRPDRRPWFAALDPDPEPLGRRQERWWCAGLGGQQGFGPPDLAFLIEVRINDPLVEVKGGTGRIEDASAVDDPEIRIHAQAQSFEGGGETPGINQRAAYGRLSAYRVEASAIQEGLPQGMAGQGLLEPRDGGRRRGENIDRRAITGSPTARQGRQSIEAAPLRHLRA